MTLTIRTPAKLNLGLEVLRRRSDGLHDLATVFQAVDIFDELRLMPGEVFSYTSAPNLAPEDDLVRSVLEQGAAEQGWTSSLELVKHIPIAAGLGGGSSDAALALRLRHAGSTDAPSREEAARIGADVPFFLRAGTAKASGTGDLLEPLPTPQIWFVVHTPQLDVQQKTATLFQGLIASDFTDGWDVDAIARALMSDAESLPDVLPSAFERQMREFQSVDRAWHVLDSIAGRVALTGAGPSIYSWHENAGEAQTVGYNLRNALGGQTIVCRAIPEHDDQDELMAFHHRLVGYPSQ